MSVETIRVDLGRDLLRANDQVAAENRAACAATGTRVLNLMSSPGAGKTTLLEAAIPLLGRLRVGVIEGDLFTDRDARRIARLGVRAVQINTVGACHLDARMVARALPALPLGELDLLCIENVGNLVCPAGFDLGEDGRVAVLSVAEGSDKPVKYPALFRTAQAVVINKLDLLPHSDFDLPEVLSVLRETNPAAAVFPVSARTGEGMEAWCRWLTDFAGER